MESESKVLEFVPKPPPDEPSVFTVVFEGTGKAAFQAKLSNVSPAQMSSLLVWLEWYIRKVFDDAAKQEAEKAE